jgi:hypothetical protein
MRHFLWLAALLLVMSAPPGMAASRGTCAPRGKDITLNFQTLMPKPIYNNRLSINGIRNLFRQHTHDVLGPHEQALGITYVEPSFVFEGETYAEKRDGGYCVYLNRIDMSLGWERMDVYVASEFQPNTCEYRAVLDHENQHVRINETALKEFAPRFRAQLEKVLSEQRPMFTASHAAATDAMLGAVKRRMSAYFDQFMQTMNARNAPLDSVSNYRETGKLCKNWDGESAPPSR